MTRYNPSEIEPKWQQIWAADERYKAPDSSDKPKYYITGMFPYPSGAGMHIGHFMEHSIVDGVARFKRATGHNVMYPMGWDAFGLPAENYAIKTGTAPSLSTETNIANFTNQLKRVGASIDWNRELTTSHPDYYRWTQWIFTQFYERGLAYQKEANQWWCPHDKTVLANEQVENGRCWRCGNEVEKKLMKQWFFKITDYADALLDEIPDLNWPEKIKTAQTNWIGRSQGAEIDFAVAKSGVGSKEQGIRESLKFTPELSEQIKNGTKTATIRLDAKNLAVGDEVELMTRDGDIVTSFGFGKITAVRTMKLGDIPNDLKGHNHYSDDSEKLAAQQGYYGGAITLDTEFTILDFEFSPTPYPLPPTSDDEVITVFTTRPDTIFGATFMVIAPEHPLMSQLVNGDTRDMVDDYVKNALKKSEVERQAEGKEKTGVFTGSYATNPANGEQIPIWVADYVLGGYGTGAIMAVPAHDERDLAFAEKYKLPVIDVIEGKKDADNVIVAEGPMVNSGHFDGMPSSEAREEVTAWLEQQGVGRSKVTYKMRDWLISRQRYWGAPIPIVHCDVDGVVPVPEADLPVLLPEVDDYEPKGESVLASQTDWVNTTCPKCGGPAKRETDTMDGYACSSWYLLRYTDPHDDQQAWDPELAKYWTPVDMYVGGDHAVAHLLYVRFWNHVFYDMGLVAGKEPVKQLVYHGLIQAEDGRKMSKSLGNVVDPLEVIDAGYGADALRTFELFLGPINENSNWSSKGIAGVYRFLNRVWTLSQEFMESQQSAAVQPSQSEDSALPAELDQDKSAAGDRAYPNEVMDAAQANANSLVALQHRTIKKVTGDINRLSFNTAIASLMEYVNELYKLKTDGFTPEWRSPIEALVQMLQPLAPHMAAELWQQLGHNDQLDFVDWPAWDDTLTVAETITIVVQVNGKVRAKLDIAADASEDDVKALALADENVTRHLGDKKPTKVIYIPGRLVSVVAKLIET